ncbi:MAG: squalene/phytoene synthase family protein [Verrucomicrobiaceae bacterium]|nr:squalene/phytoene synthase family protein [Verrucomicrobiaceae bacterium]
MSVRFLPSAMREPVSLGYLLARLTDTLADAPGLPDADRLALLEDFRQVIEGGETAMGDDLRKLGEGLPHPGERNLLRCGGALLDWYGGCDEALRKPIGEVILTILEGQVWDIRAFRGGEHAACATREDLLRYTYQVAGAVGEFWTRIGFATLGEKFADPARADAMLVGGCKLGQALQLVNILRDLHEDLPRGRCYLPKDELLAVGWDGHSALTATELSPVFHKWLGVCHGFLDDADPYVAALRGARVRFCTRLPQLLAEDTVGLLREAGIHRVMRQKVKISRAGVWRAMGRAVFF